MSNASQLPAWVSYLQALAVPIIAVFGIWIAARQMVIADERLKLDAFDRQYNRRVAVYEATRKFLAGVFHRTISDDEIRAYGLYTLDAQFLFDDALYKYLRELCQRVTTWNDAKSPADIKAQNLEWITQQGDEETGFAVRFKPFLVYEQVKRSWWLRRP